MRALLCIFLLCSAFAARAERVQVCHAYDCSARTEVEFDAEQMRDIGQLFLKIDSAEDERKTVAQAVGIFYLIAGTQSSIWQDHPGNEDDEDVEGRMDCIDHSSNTTVFLLLMQKNKWLRFHHVSAPMRRGFWAAHWAARLVENDSGDEFMIDTWYFDPGEPAAVFSLEEWHTGIKPEIAIKAAP